MTQELDIPAIGDGSLAAGDLETLFGAFNEVTSKLQQTHERLTGEVVRLQGELHRANDELERSRRLAALGEMAAGIAHEVRNPLGSIGLYAEMLIADLAESPEQRETASKILRSVQGLDGIVTDVLAFSRSMRVMAERQCASDLFERAVEACRDRLDGVRVFVDADVPIDADAGMLHQALTNLVRNALDAMGPGGQLRLSASPADGGVRLVVRDSGPGIPADVQERMFNPFFTTRAVGTGLGLAIVHRIVDAHGGRVRVWNAGSTREVPGGACVELTLPDRRDGMDGRGNGSASGAADPPARPESARSSAA
ncbi:MAG: ATP-binding protein [Planctomycetota bacterium]